MALHVLTSNMSREILLMVMRFTTAREMWLELNRLFDGGDSEEKLYQIGMDFFSAAPIEDKDMAVHLSHLKHQFYELNAEFEKNQLHRLPDILLIMKILNTLSDRYLPFLTSWKMVNKDDRTVERLTNELCMFQQQIRKREQTSLRDENEALSVQKAQTNPSTKASHLPTRKLSVRKILVFIAKPKGIIFRNVPSGLLMVNHRSHSNRRVKHHAQVVCSAMKLCRLN